MLLFICPSCKLRAKSLNHDAWVTDLVSVLVKDLCCFQGYLLPLSAATGVGLDYIQIRSETTVLEFEN